MNQQAVRLPLVLAPYPTPAPALARGRAGPPQRFVPHPGKLLHRPHSSAPGTLPALPPCGSSEPTAAGISEWHNCSFPCAHFPFRKPGGAGRPCLPRVPSSEEYVAFEEQSQSQEALEEGKAAYTQKVSGPSGDLGQILESNMFVSSSPASQPPSVPPSPPGAPCYPNCLPFRMRAPSLPFAFPSVRTLIGATEGERDSQAPSSDLSSLCSLFRLVREALREAMSGLQQ